MVTSKPGSERIPLDVFFRGSRSYIQGSLIISRVAELVAGHCGSDTPTLLLDAKFTHLMNSAIDVQLGSRPVEGGDGTLRLQRGAEVVHATVFATDAVAPRRADRAVFDARIVESGRLSGTARYGGLGSFDDSLAFVVHVNKALHERLGDGVTDVWFAGLRNAVLPVQWQPFGEHGELSLDLRLERPWGERVLTLSQVRIAPHGGAPLQFEIIYSHMPAAAGAPP